MKRSIRSLVGVPLLVLASQLCWAAQAVAQLPPPGTPWQFDATGFLQEATVANPADPLSAGQLKVNGHVVTVPANTIVILPANALTWQELFAKAPAPWGIPGSPGVTSPVPATGMAMADCAVAAAPGTPCPAAPLTTFEVHVVGNVEGTQWIAGLVDFSQQSLNQGSGYVTAISFVVNPATGATEAELQVATGNAANPVTRVRLNDPIVPALGTGRYSAGQSPDVRFTVDQDNPTIRSGTGFPMCLPRTAAVADPLCPQGNRLQIADPVLGLVFAGSFTMPDPATIPPGALPDPRIQAPFEVGDYVTFAGNVVKDAPAGGFAGGDGPTVGPFPGVAGTYVSAHTVTNNIAIYTAPGTNPAYVAIDTALMGTGGVTVIGATEAAARSRFEGFTTDPSRFIHIYGMDFSAAGAESDRDWGLVGIDPGAPTGAVKGRWRIRPPCTATPTTVTEKKCSPPPTGVYLPAPRELRAVLEPLPGSGGAAAWVAGLPTCGGGVVPPCNVVAANGITTGQYHAPIPEYIFPEQILGSPVPAANFDAMPFLASGGYGSSSGVLAPGPLVPFPTSGPACVPPTALATAPANVASGQAVTLDGSASGGGPPVTYAWAQAPGDPVLVALTNASTAVASFTAPVVAAATTLHFTLTVSACGASASTSVSVIVGAALTPTVSYTPASPVSVSSGTPVTIVATGVDPSGLPVSVSWTQTNAGAPGVPTVVTPNPTVCGPVAGTVTCTLSFTVTLPLGAPSVTIQLAAQATNSLGQTSGPDFTSVTVNPLADAVAITSAEYRTGKQRLIINASSSVVSPAVVLTLQPYVTTTGALYNPCPPAGLGCTLTNNGGGLYLLDVVGAPEPAVPPATPLVVKSSLGGVSPASALTRIRQ